jgi:peptidoglycan/LPS O-acetylase OafA/YrhL
MGSAQSPVSGSSSGWLAEATPRLHGLDALRGIAALCVVAFHAHGVFGGFPHLFAKGYLAVDFFLMLSGYLMARTSEPRLAAGHSPLGFMVARYRRFWPMMALGSLIGVPYLWVRAGDFAHFAPVLIANFLLLPWPLGRLMFALNIPAWTIFFELVANTVHVFALRSLHVRTIAALALFALGVTIAVLLAFGTLDLGARPENFLAGFPRIFLAYLIGILLHRLGVVLRGPVLIGWLALIALPGAMLGSWLVGLSGWQFDLGFVLLTRPTRPGWLSGAISFPLFAVHMPVLEGMRQLGLGVMAAVPAAIGCALIIVWWTNRPRRIKLPRQILGE